MWVSGRMEIDKGEVVLRLMVQYIQEIGKMTTSMVKVPFT